MHIIKIIHGYPPYYNAGSEVYSQSICNELSKKHKVSVFTREENLYSPCFKIRKQVINKNLTLYFINNPQGKDGYRHKKIDDNFAKLIIELKPDIAHIGHLNHLSTGIIDELNKQKIPIVFTLHDFWLMCPRGQFLTRNIGQENNFQLCEEQNDNKCAADCYSVYFGGREESIHEDIEKWSNWVHRRMDETKSFIDKINLFIAPSNYLRDRYISQFKIPPQKIMYLDYGFPIQYLDKPIHTENQRAFSFGYIGTHIPAKGVNLLIQAFQKLEQKATLKIFGRSIGQSTIALQELASHSKNKIEFCGEYKNQDLVADVFSKIDCIVVPSIWGENSPLVIHEAQACKIPVITADYGGMREYVHHNVNGLLFQHRNSYSLAEQLSYAICNPEIMKSLGGKGYLYSKTGEVPDIKNHCIKLEQLYDQYIFQEKSKLWRITLDTNPEDCNLSCIMCEEHSPYSSYIKENLGRERRRMPKEWLEPIIIQAKKAGVTEIIPSTMGEPLVYKYFPELIALCYKYGVKMNLTTNGTFPRIKKRSPKNWAQLIIPISTDIKISWNGSTADTAEKIMINLDYKEALSNLKGLIEFRDNHFRSTGYYCRITLQLTFMQNNMHELNDIIKLASELGVDRIKGHHLWTHFTEIENQSFKDSSQSVNEWNSIVEKAFLAQQIYLKPNGEKVLLENIHPLVENTENRIPENYECPFLEKELWISATGKISPCCAPDKQRDTLGDFGNIQSTTIEDVINSNVYQNLVKNYKHYELCKTCNMRKPS